jgi:DNA-binding LacI/PurR family transcriptional regulator
MTRFAIARLLAQIETGAPPSGRRVRFEPKLIVRASCAPYGS